MRVTRQLLQMSNYCKEGNIEHLKSTLDSKSAEGRKSLVSKKCTDGGTCLIVACRNGHLSIVEYLVDNCRADVEQVGSVMFDGEQVEGVPPMWCAAAAGHLSVVQFLISRNAQVNRTTITNSTALRAACFDGHYEVVRFLVQHGADIEIPNRHGHTCLMISCYRGHCKIVEYLLKRGARVNRQSAKGNTALHDCAESGNLDSLRMLLEHGAVMKKDEFGLTPIMAGANSGYKEIVDDIAASHLDIPVEEKARAYELLGANMYDRHSSLPNAMTVWNQAMWLRQTAFGYTKLPQAPPGLESGSSPTIAGRASLMLRESSPVETGVVLAPAPPTISHKNSRLQACAQDAFGSVTEFTSQSELESLCNDPDKLRLQTLLIRLRILGPDHPDTIYFIRYRGAIYADSGNIKRCLALWMYALELQRLYLEPLCHVAQSAFLSFAELFIYILSEAYSAMPAIGLEPEVIVDCLELCVENIHRGMDYSYYRWYKRQPWSYTSADKEAMNLNRHVAIALHYICMLQTYYLEPATVTASAATGGAAGVGGLTNAQGAGGALSPPPPPSEEQQHQQKPGREMSPETHQRLLQTVYRLVKLDPRVHKGHTLLHLACSADTSKQGRYPICPFPSEPVVRFLLDMGADPDVPDAEGCRPVNLIVGMHTPSLSERAGLLRVLVGHGRAHLDVSDRRGRSALDQRGLRCLAASGLSWPRYTSLKCLCARVIVGKDVPYRRSALPRELVDFIALH